MSSACEDIEKELASKNLDLVACKNEILASDEFKNNGIEVDNKIHYLEGDYELIATTTQKRTINVQRLSTFAAEADRSMDFIKIVNVPIGACEKTFGKDLTKSFSDYGPKTVSKVEVSLSEDALKRKLSKEEKPIEIGKMETANEIV